MIGWRHLHTRSEAGTLGSPGFQTVACAAELARSRDGRRLRALDELASRAIPRQDGTGSRPGLLLQPSPTDPEHCVLTRVTPREESFDGRPGNAWVESLVVPRAWLARGAWDVAAAFAVLEWWGPERGREEIARRGGAPAELPEEELPPLAPSPPRDDVAALARLVALVPDRDLRLGLLASFARQDEEDRNPPSPIHVVAAADDAVDELEEVLLLLPRAFPPSLRHRTDEEGRPRCLRLATPAEPGSLPGADLLGLRPSGLDEVRGRDGVVVDLGGGVPPPAGRGDALELARRVDRALLNGDAAALEAVHRGRGARNETDPAETAATDRRGRTEPMPRDDEPAAETAAGGPSPGDSREPHWQERETTEADAAALLELVRREREGLLADVRVLVEGQLEALREEAERLREELRDGRQDGKRRLQQEASALRDEIRETIDGGLEQLRRAGEGHTARYSSRRKQIVEDLRTHHEETLAELEEHYRRAANALREEEGRAANRLGEMAGLPPVATRVPFEGEPSLDGEPGPRRKHKGKHEDRTRTAGGGRTRGTGERLRDWLGRRPVWITLVTVATVVALAAIGWIAWPRGDGATVNGPPVRPAAGTPGTGAGPSPGAPAAAVDRAVDALLRGDTTERLLRRALREPALENRAAQAWVMVALGPDRALAETTSCALLQQAVRTWQVDRGRQGISVDGDCGDSTRQAVAEVAPRLDCTEDGWREQAACILNRRIAPGRAGDCPADWPFRRDCRWQPDEAAAFLALLRRTATAAAVVGREDHDLLANPDLAAAIPGLDEADARALLPLAHLLERAEEDAGPTAGPDGAWRTDLSEDDLQRIVDLLDRLGTGAAGQEAPAP